MCSSAVNSPKVARKVRSMTSASAAASSVVAARSLNVVAAMSSVVMGRLYDGIARTSAGFGGRTGHRALFRDDRGRPDAQPGQREEAADPTRRGPAVTAGNGEAAEERAQRIRRVERGMVERRGKALGVARDVHQ